jgi:hypothetical protein
MKEKIIKEIALDIAFMEVSVDVDKVNIAFDSIVDRVKEYLYQSSEKPSAEEWLDQEFGDAYIEHDGWGDIKFLSIGKVIEALNQYVKQ